MAYEVIYPDPWGFGSAVNSGGITGSRALVPYAHAGQGTMVGGSGGFNWNRLKGLNPFSGIGMWGLPAAYEYGARKLQESLPASLQGEGGIYDRTGYDDPMSAGASFIDDEILRYGDPITGTNYPGANRPQEDIINDEIRLDVGTGPAITPNVPRPGENWPGFGIPRALAETVFRLKGGPYYSEKFPSREFTEGDNTYTQRGLGGHYHPDEVFNMQEFGGVGEGDPRKDQWGKNIVSFADDWEEGLEDWVGKYGDMKYKTERMRRKQADKIAMLEQIQNRRAAIEAANRAASAQHLASQGIQVGGGGAWEDPGGRDRGGQGAFRENVQSMRSAGRSYRDAQGNVGYSRGRAAGGIIGAF